MVLGGGGAGGSGNGLNGFGRWSRQPIITEFEITGGLKG